MLLAEWLSRAPADQLARMARQVGLSPGVQRRELVARLVRHLTDPRQLADSVAEMSAEEWQALKVVYWGAGGGPGITVELCHQLVGSIGGRRRQATTQALLRLMDRGLVYTRKAGYREVYFIPAELQPTLAAMLTEQMARAVTVPGPAPDPDPGAPDLVEELVRFLAYVYKTEVPLTQQGLIFKRHLRSLSELLGAPEGRSEGAAGGRYPEPLGLLVDFSLEYHLVVRQDGYLRPGPDLTEWVSKPREELRLALYRYWAGRYHYPDLQAFLHLARSVGQQWIQVGAAARELEPVVHPGQRAALLPRLTYHLEHFLVPLQLFILGRDPAGEAICHLTPAGVHLLGAVGAAGEDGAVGAIGTAGSNGVAGANGAAGADRRAAPVAAPGAHYRFILQPSGELIAPRPLPGEVLWQLELAADLVQRGPALVYRLSRESVYRTLQAGGSGEALNAFLAAHSATGLPQNLEFDIRAWSQAYGQVYFQEVCLLRCADPVLAAQVKAGRRTGRFIQGEITPTDLIVRRDDYEALYQALQAEGLLPRPGILGADGKPAASPVAAEEALPQTESRH